MEELQRKTDIKISKYRKSIAFRSISGIVALLVVFAVLLGYIGYDGFHDSTLEQYEEGALLTAQTAADIIDGEDLYRYVMSEGDSGDYKEAFNELQTLCNSSGSAFIYVIQSDQSDYGHIKFIFSVANYDMDFVPYEFGYIRETTNDEYREKYRSLYEQRTFSEIVVRDKGQIETDPHITALIPLRASDNQVKGILCVQRQLDELAEMRRQYVNRVLFAVIALALLVIVGQSLYLHRTLLDPLRKITDEAQRFAHENVLSGSKLSDSINNVDEIGMLAGSIDQMEEKIQDYVEHITAITAERERIGAELSLATRIQEDMLPNEFPAYPDRTEFDIFASMTPAKEVGGDFYDFFLIDDTHLGIVMADVSGKGIPAALFMMVSKIMIKNQAMTGDSPAKILEIVNDHICANNREEMFVTVWLGILDTETGVLTASNAGHEYPMVMTGDEGFEILKDKHGFVIGGMPGLRHTEYEIRMEKGSKIFVYTDGLAEAQNAAGEFYTADRAVKELNVCRKGTPEFIVKWMERSVDKFVAEAPQFDDLTMLCLEYKGKKEETKETEDNGQS
jgi:sigma-B regulation protein RsbU (phosphoserine phosphatase)